MFSNKGDDTGNSKSGSVNMSEKKFWDKFYMQHKSEPFEWLIDYKDLIRSLNLNNMDDHKNANDKQEEEEEESMMFFDLKEKKKQSSTTHVKFILDVGCGTSMFSFNMRNALSYRQPFLICADFSLEALDLLRCKQNEAKTQINNESLLVDFIQCNCKYLPFRDDCFDLILDKGYLDSLLKSKASNMIDSALDSMKNILEKLDCTYADSSSANTPRRYLLQITDETPELRISLFDQFQHDKFKLNYYFKEIDLDNNLVYYAYFVCKR